MATAKDNAARDRFASPARTGTSLRIERTSNGFAIYDPECVARTVFEGFPIPTAVAESGENLIGYIAEWIDSGLA